MSDAIVKYRLLDWLQPVDDPLAPEGQGAAIRYASHGMRVSTDESGDDAGTVYGIPEKDFDRFEAMGAFFTDAEVEAMEAGVTDAGPAESTDSLRGPKGDVLGSPFSAGIGNDPGATAVGPHPIGFEEMTPLLLADYFVKTETDASGIADYIRDHPEQAEKAATASALVAQSAAAQQQDIPEEVLEAVAEATGTATVGPEGSEGVEGTDEPESGSPAALTSSGSSSKSGGSAGNPPEASAGESDGADVGYTSAAKALADGEGINIADVEGTGADGKVLKSDVEAYLASRG